MITRYAEKHIHSCLLGLLLWGQTSCLGPKTITRNYEFSGESPCDCYTRHPLVQFGFKSTVYSKEKAYCTRLDYLIKSDSIFKMRDLKWSLEENQYAENTTDTVFNAINSVDSIISELKNDWTHAKIKRKWKISASETEIVKEKVKYYNKFRFGRKFVGMKKYKNGVLIRSKMKQ
jgi:hypothetical protein